MSKKITTLEIKTSAAGLSHTSASHFENIKEIAYSRGDIDQKTLVIVLTDDGTVIDSLDLSLGDAKKTTNLKTKSVRIIAVGQPGRKFTVTLR